MTIFQTSRSPLVSVVIPTYQRPELLLRAVRSALAQSIADLEIIVIIDGPDFATEEALSQIQDARLRVIPLPERVGGSETRNTGVRLSRGKWIALLDDDDEWFVQEVEKGIAGPQSQRLHRARYAQTD